MGIRLYDCLCEFEEIKNNVKNSEVKGYTLISECDICAAKRETINAARLVKEQAQADVDAAKAEAKALAVAKLKVLGLTDEEIAALS